ncbi:MAG: 30S ribosomal protein S18 [Spirochaetes bacterium]|nr:30S ribosomal protein S18 [Spirochaetota bacterium]
MRSYTPGSSRPNSNLKDRQSGSSDKRRIYMKRKICRFCTDKSLKIDYKQSNILKRFTTEGGKIIPRRMSGNCSKHQRMLAGEIKRARFIALLPYVKQ